jgi:GntR family transcriptional regulator
MGADTRSDIRLLSQAGGEATAAECDRLRLAPGAPVVRTSRLRLQRGRPVMYEMACLAVGRIEGLGGEAVGNYDILELASSRGLALGPTHERAIVTEATNEEARLLGIPRRMPVLKLDRVISTVEGLPIEWRVGVCHLPSPAPSERPGPSDIEC